MLTAGAYIQGTDLPDLAIEWRDRAGNLIDFATGWTFELRSPALVKDAGITGDDTAPNVVITWDVGELDDLDPGHHVCDLVATRDSDGRQRAMRFRLSVKAAVEVAT